LAQRYNRELIHERGMDAEAQVLEVIRDVLSSSQATPTVKNITSWFADRHEDDYERKITPKWIGGIIRKKLYLKTRKSHGVFVIPSSEKPKLEHLFEKYGVGPREPPGSETEPERPTSSADVPD
jgi:hypothetical protein